MGERNNGRYIVAFEIGSSKIRGAVGVVDNSGVVDVIAVEEEKLTDRVRYGCIQNVDVANAIDTVVERLQAYPAVEPRTITGVYVGLGGRSLTSTMVDVSMQLPVETEITEPIITELKKRAAATTDPDRDTVDVVPVRFTVDNKTQTSPVGTFGQSLSARATVLSCSPQIKRILRRVITDRLGLNINGYITRPLAEAAMVLTEDERRLGCMFVDFGAETTTVSVYRGGAPVYVATLPIGSRNITLDLIALNYIEERAEEIKKVSGNALAVDAARRGKGYAEGIDYTDINNYVHARADEIVANIIAQIEYAGVTAADLPGGIVIVGGGARLRGFNELLQQQSKLPVRQGAPSASVRITDGSIHGTEMVDVISVLVAASRMPEAECLTPMPENTGDTTDVRGYTNYDNLKDDDGEDESASRIGRDDDSDYEEEGKKKSKKPKGESPEPGPSRGGFSSILSKMKESISRMTADDTEFTE
jgi:cell division protein ftsA